MNTKEINKAVSKFERLGREKFINKIKSNPNLEILEQSMKSYFDILVVDTVKKVGYIVECKHRENKYYNYSDMLLEQKKYDELMRIKKEYETKYIQYKFKVLYTHSFSNYEKVKVTELTEKDNKFENGMFQNSEVNYSYHKSKSVNYINSYKMYRIKPKFSINPKLN
jgi:hypothetical protein